jgi:hypothetical protein
MVRVIMVFLKWYVMNRKRGKQCAHDSPLVIAQCVPELTAIVTVDVNGTMRYWSLDPSKEVQEAEQEVDTWEEEFHLLPDAGCLNDLDKRIAAAVIVPSTSLGALPGGPRLVIALHSGAMAVHELLRGLSGKQLPTEELKGSM